MTFLHPALLWLLPLALVPILLHLLTLHRLRTVELSTYRFLFDSYVQQRRSMKFLEALLAVLRTLFVLFLVLTICRPVVRYWNELFRAGSGREIILLVDCSASMNARSGGTSALDRAKNVAQSVVGRLHPDDRVTLIRVGAKAEEIVSRFNSDVEQIRNRINELKAQSTRGNMLAAISHVFGPSANDFHNPLLYVFTDGQADGWKEVSRQGVERLLPPGTPVVVVDVGPKEDQANLALIGDAPRRSRAVVGLPIVLHPRVANYSKKDAEMGVNVFINEKEVARVSLALKPGETAVRKIVYHPTEPGLARGRFEIAGKALDAFPEDDNYLFTLTVTPKLKVLLVNGNPGASAFDSESLFFHTALSVTDESKSRGNKTALPELSKEFLRSLDVQEIAEAQLQADTLREASVVVLANCGGLNALQFGFLRDFVRDGGGLLLFPGDRVNPVIYNTQFFPVPGPQKEQLTAARLEQPQGDPEKPETFERLTVLDFAHPVLGVFDDPDAHYFRDVHFKRHFGITLADKKTRCWPLAEFSQASPAIVESRFGEGTVVVTAFPGNTKWTNLPLKPEFVPLVLRLVSHVEHRPEVEGPSVVEASGVADVAVQATWAPASAKVTDAAGRGVPVALERSGTRLVGAFEETTGKGFYDLEVKSDRLDHPRSANLGFAVNLPREESDFKALKDAEFKNLLPNADVKVIDASAEAEQLHGSIGKEQEIWRPLIWVLFALIGGEFMLATLSGPKTDAEGNQNLGEKIRGMSLGSWVGRMTGAGFKEVAE